MMYAIVFVNNIISGTIKTDMFNCTITAIIWLSQIAIHDFPCIRYKITNN